MPRSTRGQDSSTCSQSEARNAQASIGRNASTRTTDQIRTGGIEVTPKEIIEQRIENTKNRIDTIEESIQEPMAQLQALRMVLSTLEGIDAELSAEATKGTLQESPTLEGIGTEVPSKPRRGRPRIVRTLEEATKTSAKIDPTDVPVEHDDTPWQKPWSDEIQKNQEQSAAKPADGRSLQSISPAQREQFKNKLVEHLRTKKAPQSYSQICAGANLSPIQFVAARAAAEKAGEIEKENGMYQLTSRARTLKT
jgi:hypothetical protein